MEKIDNNGSQPKLSYEDSEMTPFMRKMIILAGGGPFLDGYILIIIGLAMMQLETDLSLTAAWMGLIGGSALAGIFVGGGVFGYLTDIVGRKKMFTLDIILMVVGSILCMFISTPLQLFILRFILGMAVGADYPIATSLATEFSPTKYRSFTIGFITVAFYVGAVAACIVGYFLIDVDGGWKWMLGSSAIPAIILLLGRWGTPESPRWLVSKGRKDEALAIVQDVFGPDAELDPEEKVVKTKFTKIFSKGYLSRIIFIAVFYTAIIVPSYAILTFAPMILGAFGLGVGKMAILGEIVINCFYIIGFIPPMWLLNTWGRRPILIGSFALVAASLALLGIFPTAATWIVVVLFAAYAFFSGGPGILNWLYPNELFPTDIRGSAMGVITAFSRIGAFVGTSLTPICIEKFGIGTTLLIMAGVTLAGLIASIGLAPETKGMTLAESSAVNIKKR